MATRPSVELAVPLLDLTAQYEPIRADVLAALFVVAGLLVVARLATMDGPEDRPDEDPKTRRDGAAKARAALGLFVGLASALALLSKESAIVMPALAAIVLAGASLGQREGYGPRSMLAAFSRRGVRLAVGAASTGIVLALVLRFVAGTGAGAPSATSAAASMREPLARLPGAIVFAMQRLVWPLPAPVFHAQVPAIGAIGAMGALLFAALVAASWVSSRSGRTAAAFTGVTLLPALLPAMTAVSLSPVADRYLYMSSLGVSWMAGVVLARAQAGDGVRRAAALIVPTALGLVLAAGATYRAVASYRDDATFWSAALARSPSDPFLVMKHGQFLADAGRFAEAESELRCALALGEGSLARSTRTIVLDNLGEIALRQGRFDEARRWLDEALAVGPGYAPAHLHVARLHRMRALAAATGPAGASGALASEESRLATLSIDKAISLEPTNSEALLLRADLALDRGDKPAAIRALEEALRYMPRGADRARIETALRSLGG
jgi:Tfp pilus assembly protein PilF